LAKSYLRYTCNGVKLGSWGGNTSGVRENFHAMKEAGSTEGVCTDSYLTSRKQGDVVLVELFKRGKTKPRVPRDWFIFVVDSIERSPHNGFPFKALVTHAR
jgi:hypothetical protein